MAQKDFNSQEAAETPGLKEAEQVMARLLLAAKNLNLYPENHAIYKKSLQDLHDKLTSFINKYGEFSLEVSKTHTEYQENKLLAENSAHQNLAYLCYRDGIQKLIFSSGVTFSELEEFLKIINAHQVIEDENQGDIVTDMWEAGLFNIEYRTNERIWQNEPLLDLSRLRPVPPDADPGEEPAAQAAPDSAGSTPGSDIQLWELSEQEIEETNRMVALEESRNFNQDVFDVLLVILNEQRDHRDYAQILEIIYECFQNELAARNFSRISRFLKNFHSTRDSYSADNHWALSYLDDFLRMISGPDALSTLNDYLEKTTAEDNQQFEELEEMIGLLSEECIFSLTPVLPKVKSSSARRAALSALSGLARADLRPLIYLARHSSSAVAAEAIMLLSETLGDLSESRKKEALPVLFEASRSDEANVRKTGVSALTRQEDADVYTHLAAFFSDPNPGIRKTVFKFFSRSRSPAAEAALMERLSRSDFNRKDTALLKALYRALGNCGGSMAFDFLQSRLFSRPLRIGKLRAMHRAGAAMALGRLQEPEAGDMLLKASKSLWPTIRRAVRRAKEADNEA
ncbi:MAG: HEAT repeat domain-containing protein [Thermodesulfobacteriota bacterium]